MIISSTTRKARRFSFSFRNRYHSPQMAATSSPARIQAADAVVPFAARQPIRWKTDETLMKTRGEIESAICDGINRFEQEYMGRGPKDIHAHLIDDVLVVRLQGVLTAAEQHLVKALA